MKFCLLFIAALGFAATPDSLLRSAKTGVVTLPAGTFEIAREIALAPDVHDLEIRGDKAGTILHAAATFRGRSIIVFPSGKNIKIRDLSIDGNRDGNLDARARPQGLPPSDVMFSRFTPNNGILAENVTGLEIEAVHFKQIAGFSILVNASRNVKIKAVEIEDSGSLNARKRNNTTGGILLEEGTSDFEVTQCRIVNVRGNGIWTHSLYTSRRNARGLIADNDFSQTARDAIQVGHATAVKVENNRGRLIGYPAPEVDLETRAFPVAIDTAGNVDASHYTNNFFEEINGKCIDLDGFHDGTVTGNLCRNKDEITEYPFGNYGIIMNNSNPDMQSRNIRITGNTIDGTLFSGIFVIGSGHTISGNHLTRLNLSHCPDTKKFNCAYAPAQPDLLFSGIYLGAGADRPDAAKNNTIEGNDISGFGMVKKCIVAAPGVKLDLNRVLKNECSDEASVAFLSSPGQLSIPHSPTSGTEISPTNRRAASLHPATSNKTSGR